MTEYIGGAFCLIVLKERLWNYSHNKWHTHGYIDLFHSICWLLATIIFYFLIYPQFILLNDLIQTSFPVQKYLDFAIAIIFFLGAILYTINNQEKRLKSLRKKSRIDIFSYF